MLPVLPNLLGWQPPLYSFLATFFTAKTLKEFAKTLREFSEENYQMASTMIFMDCSSSTTTRCLLPLTRCPLRRTIHGMGSQRWLIAPPNHNSCRTLTLRSSASPSPLVNGMSRSSFTFPFLCFILNYPLQYLQWILFMIESHNLL